MNAEGIFSPPSGLSLREQARWWTSNPMMLLIAMTNRTLSREVWEEVVLVAKDNTLAHEILDPKKVPGLDEEKRARLYALCTGGGIYTGSGAKRGRKPKLDQALEVADAMEGLSGRIANRAARFAAGDSYHGNTSKLKAKAHRAKALQLERQTLTSRAISAIESVLDSMEEPQDRLLFVEVASEVVRLLGEEENLEGIVDLLEAIAKGEIEYEM